MTALEWGALSADDGYAAGDAVLDRGWSRSFITASGPNPVVVTILAVPALIDPGASTDDRHARRDVLEVTTIDTYLPGADLIDGDPFDTETSYAWPVDFWPSSARRKDGEPRMTALRATARAHVRNLPTAWIDGMEPPPAGTLLDGKPVAEGVRS